MTNLPYNGLLATATISVGHTLSSNDFINFEHEYENAVCVSHFGIVGLLGLR